MNGKRYLSVTPHQRRVSEIHQIITASIRSKISPYPYFTKRRWNPTTKIPFFEEEDRGKFETDLSRCRRLVFK
jgi:hypothetical protein